MPPENVPSEIVGAPSSGCSAVEGEVLQRADGLRELVDRVLAQVRHRAVGGLAARDRVRPHDALVRHARVVRRRLGHQHRAAVARARPPRGPAPARPRSPSPRPRTARARARRRPAERSQPLRRDDDRRRPALHVARPAPEQAVAVGLAGERVDRPVGAARAGRCRGGPVRHSDGPSPGERGRRATSGPGANSCEATENPAASSRAASSDAAFSSSPGGLTVRIATSSRVSSTTSALTASRRAPAPARSAAASASAHRPRRPPRPRARSPSARRARRSCGRCPSRTTASCRGSSPGTRSGCRRSPGCRAPASPSGDVAPGHTGLDSTISTRRRDQAG